jgi:predicted unusual protein kinase regulating ubiquinone biosynthesis (AarF/ABC1/UbiB family)
MDTLLPPLFVGLERYRRYAALLWHGRSAFHTQWDLPSMIALLPHLKALKGPMIKMAQMAGMIPDLLPLDAADALRELCSCVSSMPVSMVHRLLARQWGPAWRSQVAQWDDQAVASASFGQVHKAQCHDGNLVAVKIQYPNMRQAVHTDVDLIYRLWQWWSDGAMDLSAFRQEWISRLHEELDYNLEATRTKQWRQWWSTTLSDVAVPCVIPNLSGPTVLTTSWMSGVPLESVQDPAHRHRIAELLLHAWAAPFFGAGILHGDPHQGNFLWDPVSQQLVILDFGCTRLFSPHFIRAFCQLYQGLACEDFDQTHQAYADMGFTQLCPPVITALNQWASFLFRPVLTDAPILLSQVSPPAQAQSHLKNLHRVLAEHGRGMVPPAEFLLLDRSIVLLGSLCIRLNVSLNWHALWHPYFTSFDQDVCHNQQQCFLNYA